MEYGSRIAEAKKKKGWKQTHLARKIGVPRQLVSKWERNLNTPSLDYALKMATALGTTVDALFGTLASEDSLVGMVRELPEEGKWYLEGLLKVMKQKEWDVQAEMCKRRLMVK
jgi:transcriptional regulator with XRE-family HTH domain